MDIFISYRDSAGAAERQFRKLFDQLGDGGWFHLPSLHTEADGWSRMLPGLVCDLSAEATAHKAPAVFMGMLGERSVLSCVLQESSSAVREIDISQISREQNYNARKYFSFSADASDRFDYLSRIVDGTVSIQAVPLDRGPTQDPAWIPGSSIGLGNPSWPHFRFPNFGIFHYRIGQYLAENATQNTFDERLADLLRLLNLPSDKGRTDHTFRKLVGEHHCRFAWASIKLDEETISQRADYDKSPAFIEEFAPSLLRDRESMKELKSFWEKRALLAKPLGYSSQGSHFAQQRPVSWPYWLQFLVLITDAGRRKLRKYRVPKLLRFRRAGKRKAIVSCDAPSDPPLPDEPPPRETIAHLFLGSSAVDTAASDIPQIVPRARRKRRSGGVVSERVRALRGTETIYALFVGDADIPPEPPCDPEDKA